MDYSIPPRIRITAKVTYEVRWTESFRPAPETDEYYTADYAGECDYHKKQITLLLGKPPRQTYMSFIHEVLHAICFEAAKNTPLQKKPLTEGQVEALEQAFSRILKLNKIG
jgi:hypothetical protein